MANFNTTADIKRLALEKSGEPTDGTSDYDSLALEYVNLLHFEILSGGNEYDIDLGQPWVWAKAQNPGTLTLEIPYETGSVSLANGSASGSFSDAPAESQAGRYLKIAGRPEIFIISSHTAGEAAFTLDQEYTDDTGATLSFQSIKLRYSLPAGILRIVSPFRTYRGRTATDHPANGEISIVSLNALNRDFSLKSLRSGVPDMVAVEYENDGTLSVRFNKFVTQSQARVEFDYIPEPSELTSDPDTTPLIPRENRIALAYGAAHQILLDKSDSRANSYFQLTQRKLRAMVHDNLQQSQLGNTRTNSKLIPRRDLMQPRHIKFTASEC